MGCCGKNKAQEEADKKDLLAQADYVTDKHTFPIELEDGGKATRTLEQVMSAEIASAGVTGYKFADGIDKNARHTLSEGGTKLNQLTPPKQLPEWVKFLLQMTGFFSLLLWFGAFLCFFGFILRRDLDNLYLGIVLALVVFITGVFSYLQDAKSSNLMDKFRGMMAQSVWIMQPGGKLVEIDAKFLVVGDVVMLEGGVKVPADLRIIESSDLRVNNAPLTGESEACDRDSAPCGGEKPQDYTNFLFFGTDVEGGKGKGVVVYIGDDTYMGKVAKLAMNTKNVQTPINKEIHHFICIVSGVAIFLGVSFFIIGLVLGTEFITNLVFMIGIIVANVPEGLLATVTVCLALTARQMAEKMVLVKNMEGVETLGSTTAICSDKTGTLTQNIMTFANLIYDCKLWSTELVTERHSPLCRRSDATFKAFHEAMSLNTTAIFPDSTMTQRLFPKHKWPPIIQWEVKGDASETAIVRFAQYMAFDDDVADAEVGPGVRQGAYHSADDVGNVFDHNARVRQTQASPGDIPFSSALKYHMMLRTSTLPEHKDCPHAVYLKGAAERILARCDRVMIDGKEFPLDDDEDRRGLVNDHLDAMMEKGRRCLGFAVQRLPVHLYPLDYQFNTKLAKLNFPMGEAHEDASYTVPDAPAPGADAADYLKTHARHAKLVFIGVACLIDPPRPAVPAAVNSCQTAGIRVVMVTGDHPKTARAIARMVNIIGTDSLTSDEVAAKNAARGLVEGDEGWEDPDLAPAIVIKGTQINKDTPEERWKYIFAHDEIVFARTSPAQKLLIVKNFQELANEIVAVTGDGVNDAPALKKADIGVAMNITGTDVAKGAADMILLDDNFASIVHGVESGRLIFDNLKKSIAYTLSSNIPEISPFLIFITVQTPLPLSTVLILCIDLGTDMVPAISMAWEGPEADIMQRPARNSKVDRLVTRKLVVFAYLQIGVIQAVAGFFTWMIVLNDYGYPPNVLIGLGTFDNWGKQVLFCQVHGGKFINAAGEVSNDWGASAVDAGYQFWDQGTEGTVLACEFPSKNFMGSLDALPTSADLQQSVSATFVGSNGAAFTDEEEVVTANSIRALRNNGYVPFLPWRARMSEFWDKEWLAWDVKKEALGVVGLGENVDAALVFSAQPTGAWLLTPGVGATTSTALGNSEPNQLLASSFGSDKVHNSAVYVDPFSSSKSAEEQATLAAAVEAFGGSTGATDAETLDNFVKSYAFSQNDGGVLKVNIASRMMQREALTHAQCAFFVSIVVVQWADLMICKTRWLSLRQQGMRNPAMNFGLVFETILAAYICYLPGVGDALGTRPIRLIHWAPAVPFSVAIFWYDETRKKIMRETSPAMLVGKQVIRDYGWMARCTYY